MTDPTRVLTLQLLQSLAEQPRPCAEVLGTWRMSCPQLLVWEDVCIDGLVDCTPGSRLMAVSAHGRALLTASATG